MSRQESVLSWQDLKRFASQDSHSEEAGVERLLRAQPEEWKALLAPEDDLSWERTATAVGAVRALDGLREDFPNLIGPLLATIWEEAAFGELLKVRLGALCNAREVNVSELQTVLDSLSELLPKKLSLALESTLSELERKFGAKTSHKDGAKTTPFLPSAASGRRFPPRDLLRSEPARGSLPANPISSPSAQRGHDSVPAMLACHRALLGEDFLFPLREGLKKIGRCDAGDLDTLFHHGTATVLCHELEVVEGKLCFSVRLDSQDLDFEAVDWEASTRLMQGSLLVLVLPFRDAVQSDEDFVLTVVEQREASRLAKGWFSLSLLDSSDVDRLCRASADCGGAFQLYESVSYFEAYRPVIDSLARKRRVPFGDELLARPGPDPIQPPEYLGHKLSDADLKVDARCLRQGKGGDGARRASTPPLASAEELFRELMKAGSSPNPPPSEGADTCTLKDILEPEDDTSALSLLNPSQMSAFRASLAQRVSLIQGPPGTGKTFIGKLLLTFFHDNQHLWRESGAPAGPIVVICYTNHALDSLLEGLLPVSRRIVRVGSRSKSAALETHTLAGLRRAVRENKLRARDAHKLEVEMGGRRHALREAIERAFKEGGGVSGAQLAQLRGACRRVEDLHLLESARLVGRADFVGFTTTGAAKYHALLERLRPRIVLLEEAGQGRVSAAFFQAFAEHS